MTTEPSRKALKVQLPEGTSAVVITGKLSGNFSLTVNGQSYSMNASGILVPANGHQTPDLVQRTLEVGQRLRDGTVVLSVDLDKDESLRVPARIFGGKSTFDNQDDVVLAVQRDNLHGHNDWVRITDDEGETLRRNWAKVTDMKPKRFWLASLSDVRRGHSLQASDSDQILHCYLRYRLLQVPVVRCGPARVPACEIV